MERHNTTPPSGFPQSPTDGTNSGRPYANPPSADTWPPQPPGPGEWPPRRREDDGHDFPSAPFGPPSGKPEPTSDDAFWPPNENVNPPFDEDEALVPGSAVVGDETQDASVATGKKSVGKA